MDVSLLLAAAAGLTLIVVDGSIFQPLRDRLKRIPQLHKLVTCYLCTGTHTGWICGALLGWPVRAWPLAAGAGAVASVMAAATLKRLTQPAQPPVVVNQIRQGE